MLRKFVVLAAMALVACTPPIDRLAMPRLQSELSLSPLVSSAMVRTVILPTYAELEEVAFETPSGLIAIDENVLWADMPDRAVTLNIAQSLADILDTRVGPDPWPFVGLPDIAIDIRVARMLAGADGVFRLTGQYYIGGDGIDFPNSTRAFEITQPMPDQSLQSIAAAQSAALLTLSEQIARSLGR
ncbi:ABC-type transport auxiliary lipoprotein family protein [Cognatiyoonia sp. IB215446]|uniref:PqiC family protein n=1 Tax=Cognatiyoonia sp. IB215446 TaxID=3097355 RepID=UPI002A0BE975|nr:ABC-type transport auxiliary lipoprotein family protein [Cognatiyoonia sp. IB215446]MDX8349477.1 ABC-type transport auxiliary lipoprotein family protein [Cognatiyoonia sp. IB215446]